MASRFQSTLPARGATAARRTKYREGADFNPRSPHGERRALRLWMQPDGHFNPRSPHGERRAVSSILHSYGISIHAPRTGSDSDFYIGDVGVVPISIHAPRTGSDQLGDNRLAGCVEFQSTLPVRGATSQGARKASVRGYFNPRSPHGERRAGSGGAAGTETISIHAPRTGSDTDAVRRERLGIRISIHAPRTGSDHWERVGMGADRTDFNPRSPHGERRRKAMYNIIVYEFQSTLPARGATREPPGVRPGDLFQSTLPARGATESVE